MIIHQNDSNNNNNNINTADRSVTNTWKVTIITTNVTTNATAPLPVPAITVFTGSTLNPTNYCNKKSNKRGPHATRLHHNRALHMDQEFRTSDTSASTYQRNQ